MTKAVTFEKDDVVTLKMNSSEELIARFDSEDNEFFYIVKPLSLMPNPQGLGMTQSMISMDMDRDELVPVRKTSVMMFTHTRKDLAAHYTENTSVIKVQPKGVLLG